MATKKDLNIQYVDTDSLIPYVNNARKHSDDQVSEIAASIKEFGFNNPILIDGKKGIIAGHGRIAAAKKLGLEKVPVIELSHLTDAQRRAYILADNRLAEKAEWDFDLVQVELEALKDEEFNIDLTGFDLDVDVPSDDIRERDIAKGSLKDMFIYPPFSVLNAREGVWQERKKEWLSLGIRSEIGRDENLLSFSDRVKRQLGGTSIFDPVLCEILYSWFSTKDDLILDPFAGGSVRGIVASKLGRQYVGVDLRQEQIDENRCQAEEICEEYQPVWHYGDSKNIDRIAEGISADFVFSCPPYADLEVYSDEPADISNMPYEQFLSVYREIILKSCEKLKENRFACFVVSEVRDKKGIYRNFVADTISAFKYAGLDYYNEAILVTSVGSLTIRVGGQMKATRKLGRTHQNILVFIKGNPKKATERLGEIKIADLSEYMEE